MLLRSLTSLAKALESVLFFRYNISILIDIFIFKFLLQKVQMIICYPWINISSSPEEGFGLPSPSAASPDRLMSRICSHSWVLGPSISNFYILHSKQLFSHFSKWKIFCYKHGTINGMAELFNPPPSWDLRSLDGHQIIHFPNCYSS